MTTITTAEFPYGIASGDVTQQSIVLWTRSTTPENSIEWRCEPIDTPGDSYRGTITPDAATGVVHVEVTGLTEGTRYRYWFETAGARSAEGRFRTVPVTGPVRIAVVSCAKYNSGYFGAYRAIAERDDIDFVLHLGDYIYEAGEIPRGHQTPGANIGRPMAPLHDCVTREDYETRYREYRGDADLLLLHSRHAMIATIDDHELSDNAWVGGADEHDETRDGDWNERKYAAMATWSDWMPTLRRPQDGDALWREIPLGEAGRILLCEARLGRTDPKAPDGEDKSALGVTQRAFLLDRLATPVAGWTAVAMPSMLSSIDEALHDDDAMFALRKLKMAAPDTAEPFSDRWDTYAWERETILDAIGASTDAVIFSGDVHFSAENNGQQAGRGYAEWTTTSITSPNLDDKLGWLPGTESRRYEEALVRLLPDLTWCDLDHHGYLVASFDAVSASCEWWFLDDVRSPTSGVALGHRVERAASRG